MFKEFAPDKIEAFHLICLSQMMPRVGAAQMAVKGGVAMRLFYASPRYSNDIDFNVASTLGKERLSSLVEGVLSSKTTGLLLRNQGTEITFVSAAKQTDTTQRWKVHLGGLEYQGEVIPTKLEFSRRGMEGKLVTGIVREELTTRYGLPSFQVTRYPLSTMISQKLRALAYRHEPKARDAFDLAWLMQNPRWKQNLMAEGTQTLTLAFEQLNSLTYDDYEQQVVLFLDNEFKNLYKNKSAWNGIVNSVAKLVDGVAELKKDNGRGGIQ